MGVMDGNPKKNQCIEEAIKMMHTENKELEKTLKNNGIVPPPSLPGHPLPEHVSWIQKSVQLFLSMLDKDLFLAVR